MGVSPVSPARSRIGTTYVDEHDSDPASIAQPQGLGDGRGDNTPPSTFDRLLDLPDALLNFGEQMAEIRNAVTSAFRPQLWDSSAQLSNTAGTTTTINGVQFVYGVGFTARGGVGAQLRHVIVGSDTAGVMQLYASTGTDYIPGGVPLRLLATVRILATAPTTRLDMTPLLEPEENVLVVLQAASGKLDFSCEYRALRG